MIFDLICAACEKQASDLHLTAGLPPMARVDGDLLELGAKALTAQEVEAIGRQITDEKHWRLYERQGETDCALEITGGYRCRVSLFQQSGGAALAIRLIGASPFSCDALRLPQSVRQLAAFKRGLVLITGATGSGKSTTLAALLDKINTERRAHIITLEDPIEYRHRHKMSIVHQREIGADTESFAAGLRSALRGDPDVLLVGELRDAETMTIAVAAAETGHLVFATLHTLDAASAVDRIIDSFAPEQQRQVRQQLACALQGIVAQQLVKRVGGGRTAAFEILTVTPALRNLIREGKTHQIASYIQTGARHGMISMDAFLAELARRGVIAKSTALECCRDASALESFLA